MLGSATRLTPYMIISRCANKTHFHMASTLDGTSYRLAYVAIHGINFRRDAVGVIHSPEAVLARLSEGSL